MLDDRHAGLNQDALRGATDGADVVEVDRPAPNRCNATLGRGASAFLHQVGITSSCPARCRGL